MPQDIFDVYPDRSALVNELAPSPQQLAEIRNRAEEVLRQHLPEDEVARILREYNSPIGPHAQHSAHHSSDPDDNIPSNEECIVTDSQLNSPATPQQPASSGSPAPPVTNNRKRKQASTAHKAPSALPESQSASSSIPEPPSPSEEPAPVKRGRGRPKKNPGDPKSPYIRRKPVSERAPNKRQKLEKGKSVEASN